jgi:hypothetical protein
MKSILGKELNKRQAFGKKRKTKGNGEGNAAMKEIWEGHGFSRAARLHTDVGL